MFPKHPFCARQRVSFSQERKNKEKVGVESVVLHSGGGVARETERQRGGAALLGNGELNFIHLILRVLRVLHVLRRSLSPRSLAGRDVVVLDEAVIVFLAHGRHAVKVIPTSPVHGKFHLQAWDQYIIETHESTFISTVLQRTSF